MGWSHAFWLMHLPSQISSQSCQSLEEFLGRSMFIGGCFGCEAIGPVERGWLIHFCLVYTWSYCFSTSLLTLDQGYCFLHPNAPGCFLYALFMFFKCDIKATLWPLNGMADNIYLIMFTII
jgi:hypothetical protein